VLQPLIDPTFSEHSHGFRPGRSAHGAVLEAQQYVRSGRRVVVDVDLEKFFDRVNHDILMDRLAKRIADKRVLRLVRLYLQAGILSDGVSIELHEGTPQGGPLSPLLANVLLDEVDRELERRGHKFVRYADDCNVYVSSLKAGQRVLEALRRCYEKLRLKVNEAKTAVSRVWGRKFLGYCFQRSKDGGKLAVSQQALQKAAPAHPATDAGRPWTQSGAGRRGPAGVCAGLEGVLPAGADAQGDGRPGQVVAPTPARASTQAVEARTHDIPRSAQAGGFYRAGPAHRLPCRQLVAWQRLGH
jgi:hypothetical protein